MVKVNIQTETGIMSVPDSFDTLVTVPGITEELVKPSKGHTSVTTKKQQPAALNELAYVIEFGVDVGRALSKSASIVEVAAFRIEQPDNKKQVNALSMTDMILKASMQSKGKSKGIDALKLASVDVDITANVDNGAARSVGTADTGAFMKTVRRVVAKQNKELASTGLDLPILESSILDDRFPRAIKLGARAASQELLITGVDPASVGSLVAQIDSSVSLAGAGIDHATLVSRDPSDLLRDRYMSLTRPRAPTAHSSTSYGQDAVVPVVVRARRRNTPCSARLKLPATFSDPQFTVRLTLRDAVGAVVESITRQVAHSDNVRLASTPTLAPLVGFGRRKGLGIGHLSVTQVDPRATSVDVYKKTCSRASRLDTARYVKIASIEAASSDGGKVIALSIDSSSPTVFRCIAVGPTGELAQSFSSVVVNPRNDVGKTARNDLFSSVSVVARNDRGGVVVEIRSVSPGIIAVSMLRRDLTIHERTPTRLTRDDGVILLSESSLAPLTFLDDAVKPGHVYEYSCVFIDRFGTSYPASSVAVIEHVTFIDNLVDTSIRNALLTVIDDDDIDYTFDVITNLITTDLQAVRGLLDAQEVLSFFSSEVKDERDLLQKLLAHQVVRHDLTSGVVESFGVMTGENFSDKALRKINGVAPLRRGNTYRYEVYALLRAPETLLNALTSSKSSAGKTYTFKPSKFLHPLALQAGNITNASSRQRNHARDEMTFGRVGNIAENELSLSTEAAEIVEFGVEKLSARRIALRWKLAADQDVYDHFLIGKEALGVVSMVAAVHNVPRSGKFEHVHEITRSDVGSLRFFVIPVKNDYSLGKEASAPAVTVEEWL